MTCIKKIIITTTLLSAVTISHAATTYDITSNGLAHDHPGSGFSNGFDYEDMAVSGWSTTGTNNKLETAQVKHWDSGLGVCNRDEGIDCSSPQHQVDNVGADDLVLFLFDEQVQFDSVVIDPYGNYDRDVSFWIADITDSNLKDITRSALLNGSSIFGDVTNKNNGPSEDTLTIGLSGGVGNALLFSAKLGGNDHDDRFKIRSLTTSPVPVPAAVWLFGSGLIGLVAVARRKAVV